MRPAALLPLLLLLLVLAVLAAARAQEAGPGGPRMVFEETEHDFGRIADGEQVDYSFRFHNAGDAPLVIEELRTTCGCTAAVLSERRLQPGEAGELQVRFDSRRRPGHQVKHVLVRSNDLSVRDREAGVRELVIRAEVITLFRVQPAFFNFAAFFRDDAPVRTVTVLPEGVEAFRVERVEVTHPAFEHELRPVEHEGRHGYELTLRARPPLPFGPVNGMVRLHTDVAAQPLLEIPLYGAVRGDVEFYPKELFVKAAAGGELGYPLKVSIARLRGGELRVLEVLVEPPVILLRPTASEPGRAEFEVDLVADAPPGVYGGLLTLLLADEENPVVRIPMHVSIAERVEVSPPALYFPPGAEGPRAVTVTAPTLEAFRVTGVEVLPPVAEAEVAPEGGAFRVQVRPVADGTLRATLVIHTDVPGEERIEVPIRGGGTP